MDDIVDLYKYRSQEIEIVFQSYNLLPFMTASKNIVLSMDTSGAEIIGKKRWLTRFMI